MSTTDTCTRRVDGNSTSMATRQLTISYDLYRAIEDLRSVPVMHWPGDVTFYEGDVTGDVVDPAECSVVSGNVDDQSELLGDHITTTTITMSTLSSELPHIAQTSAHNVGQPAATVDGDLSNSSKSSSLPVVYEAGWTVDAGAYSQSSSVKGQTFASDAGNERLSDDDVFVDVATPISADLLIDDVYEREMDELDQLDVDEVTAAEDWPNQPPESASVDQAARRICWDSAHPQTDRLLTERSTESWLMQSQSSTAERMSFLPAVDLYCTEMNPQSVVVRPITSSSVTCHSTAVTSRLDASAEEVFEEIVESMSDTFAEDDADLDALVDADNQLARDAATTKSGKLETVVDYRSFVVSEKFVEGSAASPAARLPLDRRSVEEDVTEQKRQNDLTVSLESTLNECLDALSQIDASDRLSDEVPRDTTNIVRNRKHDVTNGDVMNSLTSAKSSLTNSLGRQCVTSSSSGFQSDLMDVDIDEEFDVNVALSAADVDAGAETTSLDSLLEMNDDDDDDDESYSDQTIIRRPIPKPSVNHSIANGFAVKPATPAKSVVKTEAPGAANDGTEDLQTTKHRPYDVSDKESGAMVSYKEASATVEVLDEELITQEIVLNIVLPRRSKTKEKKRAGDDVSESGAAGVVDRRKSSYKSPHRDFHVHRVVRCSDADDRLAVSDRPAEWNRQKTVAESEAALEDADSSPGRLSLVSCYVGGPLSVELERNAESSTTEEVDDETSLRVTRRNRFKVLRAPDGSGAALFSAPVMSIRHVLDDVGRTLVGDHRRQPLPPGARVTCEAVERKSSTSLPDDDVTVVRRTIDSDIDQPTLRTVVEEE